MVQREHEANHMQVGKQAVQGCQQAPLAMYLVHMTLPARQQWALHMLCVRGAPQSLGQQQRQQWYHVSNSSCQLLNALHARCCSELVLQPCVHMSCDNRLLWPKHHALQSIGHSSMYILMYARLSLQSGPGAFATEHLQLTQQQKLMPVLEAVAGYA